MIWAWIPPNPQPAFPNFRLSPYLIIKSIDPTTPFIQQRTRPSNRRTNKPKNQQTTQQPNHRSTIHRGISVILSLHQTELPPHDNTGTEDRRVCYIFTVLSRCCGAVVFFCWCCCRCGVMEVREEVIVDCRRCEEWSR